MKKILSLLFRRFDLPKGDLAQKAINSFSPTEQLVFWTVAAVFALSGLALLLQVNAAFMVEVPQRGGELTEGIIGSPRFINPLLALSDADKDLSALVYSGLMKVNGQGKIVPDLADHYTVSEDGLTYTFDIKTGATFHDGTAVTADDVIFTIGKASDPTIKSPRRASWDGITAEKVNDHEVRFTLKQPYAPFLENTTLGILPKHVWKDATPDQFSFSQLNVEPIGSGPSRVGSVSRNAAGIPVSYTLKSFSHYVSGEPYIVTLTLKFYPDEKSLLSAYNNGDIESAYGFGAENASVLENNGARIEKSILPRIFAVFFNQNQNSVLANKEVRQALDIALDKHAIVTNVLNGYGTEIDNPIPPKTATTTYDNQSSDDRISAASAILTKAGWIKNATTSNIWTKIDKKDKKNIQTLSFSLSTGDAPELKAAAEMAASDWNKLGAKVDVQVFETGDLNQNVIRPRKYDALFFGEIIGRNLDLYPFWHSSQRTDPGLNIAMYVNNKADKILEDARATSDVGTRDQDYQQFIDIIANDDPAVFVYSPSFLYVLPNKVRGSQLPELTTPAERFGDINSWYVETSRIWSIFNHS